MRYECRWKEVDGRNFHYWVDNHPHEPHWPPSAVMRWDLKPDDWHQVWIELVDHPCALLFAPTHPNRKGPPVFADWVDSWPQGYDWQSDLPDHLHPKVSETLALLQQKKDSPTPDPAAVIEQPLNDAPQPKTNVAEVLERLSSVLLDVDDQDRPEIARLLHTLAMAPDSARTLQAISTLINF